MKTIFEHQNYLEFLRDRLALLKGMGKPYSARRLAQLAGYSSPSYFRMVITGQRALTLDAAKRFCAALKLSGIERDFLLCCVELERAHNEKERVKLIAKKDALKRASVPASQLSFSHGAILSDPVNLKLYLLAQSNEFRLDLKWIVSKFYGKLTERAIQDRVELLLKENLWKEIDGKITALAPILESGSEVSDRYLYESHTRFMKLARSALENKNSQERVVGARTFLFDPARMSELKQRINQIKAQLEAEFECLDSSRVYQCHISFFEIE